MEGRFKLEAESKVCCDDEDILLFLSILTSFDSVSSLGVRGERGLL